MNRTKNTLLVSTPAYPEAYQCSSSFSSEYAFPILIEGDLVNISGIWPIPPVQLDIFPQGTPIPDSDFELKYALVVEKRTTTDGYVIRSGALDEEAFGLTEKDAYLDFLTSLRDRYNSLRQRESFLSTDDLLVLASLRDLLVSTQG